MPRILAHQEQGMLVLPLIARPCAWRIAPQLQALQARPVDGSPLALRGQPEVDLALAGFVYELGDRLQQLPGRIASEERDRLRASEFSGPIFARGRSSSMTTLEPRVWSDQTWTGRYAATNWEITLRIKERIGWHSFLGTMECSDGSRTTLEGERLNFYETPIPDALRELVRDAKDPLSFLRFREVAIVRKGDRPVTLEGEYYAVVGDNEMSCVWQSKSTSSERFNLRLQTANTE